jgi:hypothetical protein
MNGQGEPKRRALSFGADNSDIASMLPHYLRGQKQAATKAGIMLQ